jgi:4-hydroxy-tetrahydrodipicolinate synthase
MTSLRGVLVATAVPFRDDLTLDLDGYAEHVRWLADNGCHGVCPNGSLGEYIALTEKERADVVRTAKAAAPKGFLVVPGVGAASAYESRRWAEQAAEAGADGVLALPPNTYRADDRETIAHFEQVCAVGLPVIAYNNPHDTKVDLTPSLLAELARFDNLVGVKEFTGDVRRVHEIADRGPRLEVFAGADDVVLESLLMGAVGWVAGFPNAFPAESVRLYDLAMAGKLDDALPLYRALLPAFRWDSRTEFVQAIKIGMDMVGRRGGPVRLPRLALEAEVAKQVRADMERAIAACS